MIEIFPIPGLPIFQPDDDLAEIVCKKFKTKLKENDILIIAQTVVSRCERCEIPFEEIEASPFAQQLATMGDKDPKQVELVLREAKSIVRMSETLLITETHHGFICANSGVDKSNARPGFLLTLPKDPDASARVIRNRIKELTGLTTAIIITDTFGRPFRVGTTNIAVGVAGIEPLEDFRGRADLFGYVLQHTVVARADELATAGGLIMGQAGEGFPVIVVRGFTYDLTERDVSAKELNRLREEALFW